MAQCWFADADEEAGRVAESGRASFLPVIRLDCHRLNRFLATNTRFAGRSASRRIK
jgi:hypothetical protein